jgi:hypothetical protein
MYEHTQQIQGIYVADPTKVISTIPNHTITSTSNGIFGGVLNNATTDSEPYVSHVDHIAVIRSRIEKLELNNRLLKLKILQLEGTFTKEEVINIRAMLTSNDEASITLADSIIENA